MSPALRVDDSGQWQPPTWLPFARNGTHVAPLHSALDVHKRISADVHVLAQCEPWKPDA
jgi:hypothetical protein